MYLGTYCLIDAHTKCPLGAARCSCTCHHPPPIVRTPRSGKGSRPANKAIVVIDSEGRRVCPGCLTVLVKKNPHGPGRYPRYCEACR